MCTMCSIGQMGAACAFTGDADYEAFERILGEALEHVPGMRLLAYCLMPNHWHLVLWPRRDGELSDFGHWLALTHTQRWHAHYHNVGVGHLYQGRFKSFVVEADDRSQARPLPVCGAERLAGQFGWSCSGLPAGERMAACKDRGRPALPVGQRSNGAAADLDRGSQPGADRG